MRKPVFYKIPKGITLEEMALFFEVDKNYLKRYHNIHCEKVDLIEKGMMPKHLEKLFVPPKDKDYEKYLMSGDGDLADSLADDFLRNRPFYKEYGVIQTTYENGKQKNRISFLTEVKKHDASLFSITRKSIYIDYKAPDLTMAQIAEKAGSIFFPLEVETLENGNLKQICNMKEIKERWKVLRPDMLNYYKGSTAKERINRIDHGMESKSAVQNRILGSLFYRLYFLPFRDYVEKIGNGFDLHLPFFPYKNKVKYQVAVTEQPVSSEAGKMIVELKGKLTDTRSFSDMKNGKIQVETLDESTGQCKGSINAVYKFSKKDGSICSVEAEVLLESENGESSRKIKFELYQQ